MSNDEETTVLETVAESIVWGLLSLLIVVMLFLFSGCSDFNNGATIRPVCPPCAANELCSPPALDSSTAWSCEPLCANQFHCWSGCCLFLGDAGLNVCRAAQLCYGADAGVGSEL